MSLPLPCTWLGLDDQRWPPDHYALLGLERGEGDVDVIEQRVLERLEKVRCHQLASPEKATEVMTLFASAFACLTNPARKRAYDSELGIAPPAAAEDLASAAVAVAELRNPLQELLNNWQPGLPGDTPMPKAAAEVQLNWKTGLRPPPVRSPAREPVRDEDPAEEAMAAPPTPAEVFPFAAPPVPQEDPAIEAARASTQARRGLGTRRALLHRIQHTRELLWVWKQLGDYLNDENRRLTRRPEVSHFLRNLTKIPDLLEDFPPLLGQAGQPGYLVVTLARQQNRYATFQMLLPKQRVELARHWRAGHEVLLTHLDFLRQELRAVRRKNLWARGARAVRAALNDHPGKVLLVVALVALLESLLVSAFMR